MHTRTKRAAPAYDNYLYLTVDIVLVAQQEGRPHVLLIRRGTDSDAFPGMWALPGGYVDAGEWIDDAARRELAEETGLIAPPLRRIGIFDDPGRDPRERVVSVAYAGVLSQAVPPAAGDDAADAAWVAMAEVLTMPLAFDHRRILAEACRQL